MYKCKRCGKGLTSPESKSRGYGLDCYQRDCVHTCDRCGESLDGREGYYHEDSGMKVCSEKCGEEVFKDFKERCDELDIFFTYFGDN